MRTNSTYYKKPKRGGGGFFWFLVIIFTGAILGGAFYYYKTQEEKHHEFVQKQNEAKEKKRAEEQARLEKERAERERILAEQERIKLEAEEKLKGQKDEEARRKAEELAKQQADKEKQEAEEEEARKKAAAEEEERLRREKEQEELDKNKQKELEDDGLPKPFAMKLPDLKPFTPESKDEIPMDKDQVIGKWSWDKVAKYDLKDYPTADSKWNDRAKAVNMAEKYKKWREEDPKRIKASPSAKDFPGVPEEGAEVVARTIIIDSSIGGWHSTGLYAPPGTEISFFFTGAFKNGVSVRIGCHTDSLIHDKVSSWSRLPIMGNSAKVEKSRISLADPSGGLVYVCVDNQNKHPKTFKVKISGAVPAPLYILGETTPEQWKKQLETAKVPWGEIRTPRLVYTMSIEQLKKCGQIKEVAEILQKGMALQDWIAGWDEFPSRIKSPMRFVVDRQISIGFGHSGYPAMGYMSWADSLTSGSILTEGDWGLWHELGHNHQGNPVAMEGQTEVSVNIFSLACHVLTAGIDPNNLRGMSPLTMGPKVKEYLSDKNVAYNDAPNEVQLFLWGELMYHFGVEPFRQVHLMYHKKPYKSDKMSDADKWNWIMRAFGKVLQKDLSLYFETWKLPIDAGTKAQFKRLPQWKPRDKYPSPSYLEED